MKYYFAVNFSISGNTLLSGTDLTTKFASMLATAEANRQGTELVAGFDVKIDYVTAQETKFIVHTVFVLPPPPPPYDCTNASSLPPNPTVETNINYVHTEALACLNANIRANNASTILAMNICSGYDINDETTYWAPDLLFVSAAGDLPWADIVVGEGGRKCSSLGECLPDRPLQYPGISLVITAKQFVEDQVRIAEDIANDIENEAFAPTGGGQAVTPDVFMWRVNLDLDPEIPDNPDGTPGTETILFMEIRDVQFARYLIACN